MTTVLALPRPIDDGHRPLTPVRGADAARERFAGRAGGREGERAVAETPRVDEFEILGPQGGGRGRPVVSLPSSAFFAQHFGQTPGDTGDEGGAADELLAADAAYRNALDLGVVLNRPTPLSIAV